MDAKFNLGFVANPKRFNVAVTRAQALLVVVGDPKILGEDKHWGALLRMCAENRSYCGVRRGNEEDSISDGSDGGDEGGSDDDGDDDDGDGGDDGGGDDGAGVDRTWYDAGPGHGGDANILAGGQQHQQRRRRLDAVDDDDDESQSDRSASSDDSYIDALAELNIGAGGGGAARRVDDDDYVMLGPRDAVRYEGGAWRGDD
jgi:hypothetical protein